MDDLNPNLDHARDLIHRIFTPSVLKTVGQELHAAYFTSDELERGYLHSSTIRETSPALLRGLLETALVNIAQNLDEAEVITTPNEPNTSKRNELILCGQIRLSVARCHPWTGKPAHADFRQMRTFQNVDFLFPEVLDVPNVADGAMLNGYILHLPGARRSQAPRIMSIYFPTPDGLGEIVTIDLKPYLQESLQKPKAPIREIEEAHDLAVLEEQKTS